MCSLDTHGRPGVGGDAVAAVAIVGRARHGCRLSVAGVVQPDEWPAAPVTRCLRRLFDRRLVAAVEPADLGEAVVAVRGE